MGCMCSKVSAVGDSQELSRQTWPSRKYPLEQKVPRVPSSVTVPRVPSSVTDNRIKEKDGLDFGDGAKVLSDKSGNASARSHADRVERKKTDIPDVALHSNPSFARIPKAAEAEQVAAGWPRWLAAEAGDAIRGWVPRRANTFAKLDKIGQGTYSTVYKARDVTLNKIVALKKVRFDNHDIESIKFMAREIIVLRRLDHPNVIKLEGLITSQTSCSMYLIFEYMEHDLTGLASRPDIKLTEPQVKCYMQQLLSGLDHCHSHGVLHRDVKGSNLLIDNNGILKIADFGLATFFCAQKQIPLTSRVVTLWYRPPELLLGACLYGPAVDIWSAGCILGELYAGKPILAGKTEVEQLHKIFKLCGSPSEEYWNKLQLRHSTVMRPPRQYKRCLKETFREFPTVAVGLMDILLSTDPTDRGTAAFALESEFFTTSPLPCDPSSLPKYPPSKEIDVKLQHDDAGRQRMIQCRGLWMDASQQKRCQLVHAANANADSLTLKQKRAGHPDGKSRSEIFNPLQGKPALGPVIDRPKELRATNVTSTVSKGVSHSAPLIHGPRCIKSGKAPDEATMASSNTTPSADLQKAHDLSPSETVSQSGVYLAPATREESRSYREGINLMRSTVNSHDEEKKVNNRPPLHGRQLKGNQIHVSASFLVSSNNVDTKIRERELHIQEYARRARGGKVEKQKV